MAASGHRALRIIALYKLAKALLLLIVAAAAFDLVRSTQVQAVADWIMQLPIHNGHPYLVQLIDRVLGLGSHRFLGIGAAACVYAALFSIEGWGLWREKRWAEYFTVIVTASLIPIEIWEIVQHVTWLKVATLVANIAIVLYLLTLLRRER
jgi:uncharacterized membrane protein (DUF2068 family)